MVKAKATLQQQVIITFSRKMYESQRNIRNKQIERAKKMIEEKDPEAIIKRAKRCSTLHQEEGKYKRELHSG